MTEVLAFMDELMKRLQRPIKDLDDVRSHMAALADLREAEIRWRREIFSKFDCIAKHVNSTHQLYNKMVTELTTI